MANKLFYNSKSNVSVKSLIEILSAIEDKSIPVCVSDSEYITIAIDNNKLVFDYIPDFDSDIGIEEHMIPTHFNVYEI